MAIFSQMGPVTPLLVFLLVAAGSPISPASSGDISGLEEGVTLIDGRTKITEPGYYRLTEDIVNSSQKRCVWIRSNDVIFDGDGHTVDGEGPTVGDHRIPIRIGYSNQVHVQNVTVKDVVVTEWHQGVGVSRASNSVVRNITASFNYKYGIYLGDNATNNTVLNNVVTDTLVNGILLAELSDGNKI